MAKVFKPGCVKVIVGPGYLRDRQGFVWLFSRHAPFGWRVGAGVVGRKRSMSNSDGNTLDLPMLCEAHWYKSGSLTGSEVDAFDLDDTRFMCACKAGPFMGSKALSALFSKVADVTGVCKEGVGIVGVSTTGCLCNGAAGMLSLVRVVSAGLTCGVCGQMRTQTSGRGGIKKSSGSNHGAAAGCRKSGRQTQSRGMDGGSLGCLGEGGGGNGSAFLSLLPHGKLRRLHTQ